MANPLTLISLNHLLKNGLRTSKLHHVSKYKHFLMKISWYSDLLGIITHIYIFYKPILK